MIESVIRFSFKYKLLVVILFPGICIGGGYSLTRLPIDAFPDISPNLVQVFAEVEGMVLLSRFEYLKSNGVSLKEAVIEGALSKLRPVVMTTITTALGLLPLALTAGVGSEIQRPLAIVVLGGLSSSTVLTLIVLPSLYWRLNRTKQPVQ